MNFLKKCRTTLFVVIATILVLAILLTVFDSDLFSFENKKKIYPEGGRDAGRTGGH